MMRRAGLTTGLTMAAAVLFVLANAGAALADYGAIAYDQGSCSVGRSWHYNSPRRAADVALSECGHSGCRIILEIGPGLCGALAITDNCRGYGWARRESRDAARLAAMENCQHYNAGQCTVRTVDCNH